ncbi:MAG: ribosome maturation factor RimP [Holosporales bacterium]|nr:ribosome maturation factor RimP [Holosporales bacterium]
MKKILSGLVKELGCEIVVVNLFTRNKTRTLQIMIERLDGSSVSIDDCERISKAVSISLDVHDPIKGKYNLEVSSTGIDRSLVSPDDFIRFSGRQVVVNTYVTKWDRKTFKGNLESADECGIKMTLDSPLPNGENAVDLMYEEICSAHIDGFKN